MSAIDGGGPFALSGRVAIVTGAGSGIGRGTAEVLAEAGATVVCADIDSTAAKATSEAIVSAGGAAVDATLDVTRRDEVVALYTAVADRHGRLDVAVNNAGILREVPVLDITEAQLDEVLAVNLKGVLWGCQAAGAIMTRQGGGSIVNMASGAIDGAAPNLVAYSISKAGVVQITRTMVKELGASGVRVNAIAPGLVETGITQRHFRTAAGDVDQERRAAFLAAGAQMAPLGRMGTPRDIGLAVLYFASDVSAFVTGQVLRPNGGSSMP